MPAAGPVAHQVGAPCWQAGGHPPAPLPCCAQTLLESPLGLAERLPCDSADTAAAPASQASLRRATSMQALGSNAGGCASLSSSSTGSGGCLRSPSLPTVLEQGDAEGPAALLPVQRGCAAPQLLPAARAPQHAGLPPRRCHSESALAALEEQQRQQHEQAGGFGGQHRPLWLSRELQPPPKQHGWGSCSPAPLQDLACRQVCASLAAEYGRQHGGQDPPAGLADVIEAELR